MATKLISSLSMLIATVSWSLAAAGGLDYMREINNMSASSNFSLANSLNDGIVYPSSKQDFQQTNKQHEVPPILLSRDFSAGNQSSFAQQLSDNRTSIEIKPIAELISSLISSNSSHLFDESNKRHNQSISQLTAIAANDDNDNGDDNDNNNNNSNNDNHSISSIMYSFGDTDEYLPPISSSSVFSFTLSSPSADMASPLLESSTSMLNSATFSQNSNSTTFHMMSLSNSSLNEVGINGTDPFAFTTELRIMALPIEIQASTFRLLAFVSIV